MLYGTFYEKSILYLSRLWLCTFTLSVSIGAALLLPVSIVSNELLLMYQSSYYVKWLNSSLIHGMYISVWTVAMEYVVHVFSDIQLFLEILVFFCRILELDFSWFVFVFVCCYSVCIFLHWVWRICWVKEGIIVYHLLHRNRVKFYILCVTALLNLKLYVVYLLFQGIKARIYETFVVLALLVIVVTSIVWVALGIVNSEYVFGPENENSKLLIPERWWFK